MLGAFHCDNELIGVVGLSLSRRRNERHRATVIGTHVDPGHARKGIAIALMRSLIDLTYEHFELEQLHLSVTADNAPAINLYVRAGFLLAGVEPAATKINGVCHDKQHMFLSLNRRNVKPLCSCHPSSAKTPEGSDC